MSCLLIDWYKYCECLPFGSNILFIDRLGGDLSFSLPVVVTWVVSYKDEEIEDWSAEREKNVLTIETTFKQ